MTPKPERKMTLLEHLEELRGLILQCFLVLILACGVVGVFFPKFAAFLNYPLQVAVGQSDKALQGLVTTSPMGVFSVLIQVCLLGGLAIALPFMLLLIARFISPGLEPHEKKILLPGALSIMALFLLGAGLSYFFIIPLMLKFSIDLNQVFGFELIWSAPMYYGMVVWMTLGVGLCFEFPLVLVVLMSLGILTTKRLKSWRRHTIVLTLVVAAAITPSGDPFSLALLAIPLYALYELSILVGMRIEKKKGLQEEPETDEEMIWPGQA